MLRSFIQDIQSAKPARRCLYAFLAGTVATLALAPVYVFPAFFAAFTVLFLLLGAAKTKMQGFLTAWSFGFGYFTFGLYWISFAMFTDFAAWWWVYPFALLGLPFLLAFFSGMAGLVFQILQLRGFSGIPAFAVIWVFFEFLRGHMFTGFPWNLPGYIWTGWIPMLQGAAYIGVHGLSLVTVFLAVLPAVLFMADIEKKRARRLMASGVLAFMALFAAGQGRLMLAKESFEPKTAIRIVQPNISQTLKWDPALQAENFMKLIRLSEQATVSGAKPDMIVWPETAVGFNLPEDIEARRLMGRTVAKDGVLLTGALRFGEGQFFNSVAAVTATGSIAAWYDKFHLVPFGEYIPLREFISVVPFAAQVSDVSDFTAGHGPQTVRIGNLPSFSPLVCYEVIFSGAVVNEKDRPQFLLNVTNDGWYGHTAGPHQHFAIAQMRAAEEGIPLIRAANTGISGIVDPYGRIVKALPLGQEGIIDTVLPAAISAPAYAKAGGWPYVIIGFFMLLMSGYDRRIYTFV